MLPVYIVNMPSACEPLATGCRRLVSVPVHVHVQLLVLRLASVLSLCVKEDSEAFSTRGYRSLGTPHCREYRHVLVANKMHLSAGAGTKCKEFIRAWLGQCLALSRYSRLSFTPLDVGN
jgi:hypothetical protein